MTIEVVDGVTLEDLLADGPLEAGAALELLGQVAVALDAAHARGVVHPDLQPAAVLIDAARRERAVVGFGSGREGAAAPAAALQYVSPERILGRALSPRSDVYSLSALAYRCLTGSVPFPRGRGRAVLFWHLHAPRPRVTGVRGDLSAAIDGVLARGMAVDPSARHPTASALVEDARRAVSAPVETDEIDAGPTQRRAAGAPVAADEIGATRAQRARRAGAMRRACVSLGAAVAIAAGAAGFVVAGALEDSPATSSPASAGRLRLAVPADWRPSTPPAATSILRPADALVLAAPESSGTMLIAGTATAGASVELLRGLDVRPPSGQLVSLGPTQARRYRTRSPTGTGPMTLYLAPTDRGVATVACLATSTAAASFLPRCDRVAASLRLAEGRFTPAAASPRQATGLARAFGRLNAARTTYRLQVRRTRTGAGQAAAARTLSRAHAREASALRSLVLTGLARPGGRASLRGLERAAAAYRALAAAAARGDRRGYSTARGSALAADLRIRRAVGMLRVVGYAP